MVSIKPLSGPSTGNTRVTLSGNNLENILSCRFSMGLDSYVVPTSVLTSLLTSVRDKDKFDEKYCITPSVTQSGIYTLDLNYNNETWITTKYQFNFFTPPLFFSGVYFPLKGPISDLNVYGEFFPESQVYFKFIFKNSFLLLAGNRISSSHVLLSKVNDNVVIFLLVFFSF